MNFALLVFAFAGGGIQPDNHVEIKQVTFETRALCEDAGRIIARAKGIKVTECFQVKDTLK